MIIIKWLARWESTRWDDEALAHFIDESEDEYEEQPTDTYTLQKCTILEERGKEHGCHIWTRVVLIYDWPKFT